MLDDGAAARRAAAFLGLNVTGTLGVLLLAKQAGIIEAVLPFISELRSMGFHMSNRVVEMVLSRAGEEL